MSRKKKNLQKRLSKRNHSKWARWYVENHEEELDKILQDKYGLELNYTQEEKIIFIKSILAAYWKMITTVLFVRRSEIYWQRIIEDNKKNLVIAFLMDKENRAARLNYEERGKQFRSTLPEVERGNDSTNPEGEDGVEDKDEV